MPVSPFVPFVARDTPRAAQYFMRFLYSRGLATSLSLVAACACSSNPTNPGGAGGVMGSAGSSTTDSAGMSGAAMAGSSAAGSAQGGLSSVGGGGSAGTTGSLGGSGGSLAGATASGASAGSAGEQASGGGTAGNSSGGGTGGTSADGWTSILPTDDALTGWFPYVKGFTPGMDPPKTFRRDPQTGYLEVTYADYPNNDFTYAVGGKTEAHLGLIYYDRKITTDYKVRITYRFKTPQAANPVSWGKNNSGLFVFGTDPHKITGDPDFPTAIEIQILGSPSAGGNINTQLCLNSTVGMYPAMIGTQTINGPSGCFASKQSTSDFQPATSWATVEADVSVTGTTKIYQYAMPDDAMPPATPIQTFNGPVKTGGQAVNGGWLSLQSESQPCEFRKVELKEMP
ncbi:MAG: family 16 glycoside hydrolase [Polyangiaceae bacterium]